MHPVLFVHDKQLVITDEHRIQVLVLSLYSVEVHDVQEVPLDPSAHSVQYEELVHCWQLLIAELHERHLLDCR